MNKKEHIKSVILEFDKIINFLFDEYDLDISLPIEKCLSNESIKDIVLTEESTILDSLDSIYYKNTKDLFHELKKIEKLGSPKLHYYKDNTIRVTSSLIDTYKLDGHIDNLYNFKTTYLSRIKEFLEGISTIKYIQYLVDIEGLILELGEPKLTIDGANIIFRYPFNIDDIYFFEYIKKRYVKICSKSGDYHFNEKIGNIDIDMASYNFFMPHQSFVVNLKYVKDIVVKTADEEIAAAGVDLKYEVGTMIEIPRAALTADDIAKEAEFFCFGTNDLTQMTYGFSRDDAGKFLNAYYDKKIFENDPFAKLDQTGVGKLMETAIKLGKPVNPKLHVGICGEHGGDPSSVEFCHKIGLDYVSCSPFRVPIARLAAAQAAIANK